MKNIAIQSLLRPALTPVPRCKDYAVFRKTVEHIDRILTESSLESKAIDLALEGFEGTIPERSKQAQFAIRAVRMSVLDYLLGGLSLRDMSCQLGRSDLLADFCRVRELDGIRGISKSNVERALKFFCEEDVRGLVQTLTEIVGNADLCDSVKLEKQIDMNVCFIDSTCLEANIHFPVDWVLLKDVALTLLQAITLIRNQDLLHRMPGGPKALSARMNKLCISMTHARRQKDARKKRKQNLREMKKLLKRIGRHALRHAQLLRKGWRQTKYSEKEALRIIERVKEKTDQIPLVMKQAHERIIGGRQVKSTDKILSVYEDNIHLIVRGKAGKEVEFGNTLLLCESPSGYLPDWKLYRERAPSEYEQLKDSLQRQNHFDLQKSINEMCGDRAFASQAASKTLASNKIYDALTPRDPRELQKRMQEPRFVYLQRRRGGLEGRIGVLKNRWQGGRIRSKGFTNRSLSVAWSVLSHNLWIVAKMLALQDEKNLRDAA